MDPPPARGIDMEVHGQAVLGAASAAHIGVAVSVVEPEGLRNVYVSEVAAEILGWPQSDLLARDVLSIVAPEDLERLREGVRRRLQGGGGPTFHELTVIRKDGSRVPVEISASEVNLGGRRATFSFVLDLSARKAAEQARLQTEARFRQLIERAPGGIGIIRGGHFVYANAAAAAMFGVSSAEQLYGVPLTRLVSAEDLATLEGRMKMLLDGQVPQLPHQTYSGHRPDGNAFVIEASSVPFVYEGKPSILTLLHDVTERRGLETRLFQADRLAALGTMAAGVAHEINNPLAYVMLNLDWVAGKLSEGAFDPTALEGMKEMLREARHGVSRVAAIVNDLRSFSRSDGESRHAVDLAAVVRSAVRIAEHEIRPRAHVMTLFEPAPPVWANEGRIEQVVLNLLLNASQAMPEARVATNQIRVSVRGDGAGHAIFEVSDNGDGIPPEIVSRIFDPFFTTKAPGVGTGLGLSICHGIVASFGGQISVHSEAHVGTTFRVTFPATTSTEATTHRFPSERPTGSTGIRARVLIVDDEVQIANTMREILAPEHDVIAVTGGMEALDVLRSGAEFDVIFCDLMMPDVTGIELYGQVREGWPGLEGRIVFMTGGAFTPRAAEFLASIDNRRVEKPFSMSLVERVVREML